MDTKLFKKLISQDENQILDFKEMFYKLEGNSTQESELNQASFIKDILALTNTIRTASAFIILGIKDKTKEEVGLNKEFDDKILRTALINRVDPVPDFSYENFKYNGKIFGIIEIPVKLYDSPCVPTKDIGTKIRKGITYIRRGSVNDQATTFEVKKIFDWLEKLKIENNASKNATTTILNLKNNAGEINFNNPDIKLIPKTEKVNKNLKKIIFIPLILLIIASIVFGSKLLLSRSSSESMESAKVDSFQNNNINTDSIKIIKEINEKIKDKNAKRLAIIYFDNNSNNKSLNILQKGLADMLISDLYDLNMLILVERDKIESVLKEQNLNNSKLFDPSTASKIGKLLGAQIILTGSIFEMNGTLRIDARFIDVQTIRILKSDGVEGSEKEFFKMQKKLTWKIIKNLETKITDVERTQLQKSEYSNPISFQEVLIYSKALDLIDQGKIESAKDILQKIVLKNPDFAPAKKQLQKLSKI